MFERLERLEGKLSRAVLVRRAKPHVHFLRSHVIGSRTRPTLPVSNDRSGMQGTEARYTDSLNWYMSQGETDRGNDSESS